jgi:hypothetical protein
MDALSWFALIVLFLVVLILLYGMIAIHDIPYIVAKKRDHPHQDAIHYGGWISLFTLHAIWPFLWIWATAYHPEGGYAGKPRGTPAHGDPEKLDPALRIAELERQIALLEEKGSKSRASQAEQP